MNIVSDILLTYETHEQVKTVHQALLVDNDIYVNSEIKEKTIRSQINSPSLSSFLHTLDDYLACVSVAETVMQKKHK